jgi:rhodanese-related sulfurtransferase
MKHSQAFERLVAEIRPRIKEIQPEEVLHKQGDDQSFQLIDVREDHEWQAGSIPGAFHIGRGILERDVEKHFPDYDRQLVLYCGGGYRSALAADTLQRMGYKRILSMAGGFRAWNEKGFPTTAGTFNGK